MEIKEESYKLLDDGRVEITIKSDMVKLKALDNETIIGEYYNTNHNYIESKEVCLSDLQAKHDKYSEDLEGINRQIEAINIKDSLAEELKEYVESTKEIVKAVNEIKDFSNEGYVANNPKKFGKMLKEARMLKETQIGELKEMDKVVGLHNKKLELLQQKELYDREVNKIAKQIEEVKKL